MSFNRKSLLTLGSESYSSVQWAPGAASAWWHPYVVVVYIPLRVSDRSAGESCTSVQWGAWGGVGMVASSTAVLGRMRRAGIATVSPAAGLAALAGAIAQSQPLPQVSPRTTLLQVPDALASSGYS